jgi:hypothetical protein
MANFYLQHPLLASTSSRLLCQTLRVSGKKNTVVKPYATGNVPSEAQTTTPENLKYVANNVFFTEDPGTLSYNDLLTLYLAPYKGAASTTHPAIKLVVTYDTTDTPVVSKTIANETIATTEIYVVMESFDVSFDTKSSKDAKLPTGSITFVETD